MRIEKAKLINLTLGKQKQSKNKTIFKIVVHRQKI